MAVRIASAVSFSTPLQLTTRGWEQETLYPIWKAMNGLVVYPDPYQIPFAATFYHWLFIESYAVFSSAVFSIFSLEDAWLPTVGRFLTLAFLFAGTALSYSSFLNILEKTDRTMKILCLSFSIFIFFGPLMGFFGFSVSSDIGALVFDILTIFLFWKFYPNRPFRAVLLCAVSAYCAWGFKQVNVFSTITVGLYLLYRLDWKHLFIFSGILVAAYATTFIVGGPLYLRGFFESSRIGFSLEQFAANIKIFILKSTPYLAALGALALAAASSSRFRRSWLKDNSAVFVLIGFCTAGVLSMLFSTKVGSADSYYFVFTYFIALTILKGYAMIREEATSADCPIPVPGVLGISMLGWAANMAAVAAVFLGLRGVVSVAPQHEMYSTVQACANQLPKPVFIDNAYLSLPWMNPAEHHFVVSYSYPMDRREGLEFERGGIGGLIKEGYFGSLLLGSQYNEYYDGASLGLYEKLSRNCRGYFPYVRR